MKAYAIVKTINGRRGQVLAYWRSYDEAHAHLVSLLAGLAGCDTYLGDEEDRQALLDTYRELQASPAEIEKIQAATLPCILAENLEEVANAAGGSFAYDNFTIRIEEREADPDEIIWEI